MHHDKVASEPEFAAGGWFEWLLGAAACLILFSPLVLMYYYYQTPDLPAGNVAADTVGIAVILRATMRRLFRSGSRSVLQTAVGTVTRASTRTMTRRSVRVGMKSLAVLLGRSSSSNAAADEDATLKQPVWLAPALGLVALAASLTGVLLLLDVERPPDSAGRPQLAGVLNGLSMIEAVALGVAPLLAYVVLLKSTASLCGATVKFRTGWESMLLQAYFTGSGSYLPLATDSETDGAPAARMRLAFCSLGGLFALHLACRTAAATTGIYAFEYLGGMFLLYCFVFSFPIAPLDGYYLWTVRRWLWVVVWLPILASFIWQLPEPLHVIL